MTFNEANDKLMADGKLNIADLVPFGIETTEKICKGCSHFKKCMAREWFYNPIVKCSFFEDNPSVVENT